MKIVDDRRRWILLAALYSLVVFIVSFFTFPDGNVYYDQRINAYITAVAQYDKAYNALRSAGFSQKESENFISLGKRLGESPEVGPVDNPQDIRKKYYPDLSDEQLLQEFKEKYNSKIDSDKIDVQFQKNMALLFKQRLQFAGIAISIWILPLCALYGIGIAINRFRYGDKGDRKA